MTDKQIIVNGVDVSGCLFYQANFEEDYDVKIKHYCSNWHNSCESNNNSNCYYKNWQRKEQECEKLREQLELNTANAVVIDMAQRLYKYKQALTEIKQLLEDALDTDKTNAEQSFDNFYKAIKLCEVLDE